MKNPQVITKSVSKAKIHVPTEKCGQSAHMWIQVKKVKVSHSLLAVGAVGVRVPLYLGHS